MTTSTDVNQVIRSSNPTSPTGGLPSFARWPVLAVAASVAAAHVAAATVAGRYYDEALTLAIGRHHLDWGAADQPPMAPLLAALTDWLAPGSQLVLAAPAVLATAGAVLVAAFIARELGGDNRAQVLTALAQGTGLSVTLTGHWLTPYSLEPIVWLAIGWLLVRWIRVRDDRLLLALGIVIGIGVQTKFQVFGLGVVLLLCLAVVGPRDILGRPLLWAGAGIAALIAAPTLVWQATNGWPQLAMAPNVAAQSVYSGGRTSIAAALLYNAGLIGLALTGFGLVALLSASEHRHHRFLGVAFVGLFLLFALLPGRSNYLVGFYGLASAAGAVALQRRREGGRTRWRWVAWPAAVLSIVWAGGMLAQSLSKASPVVADAVVATAAHTYDALPAAQRERTVLMGDTYMYSAYLDTASPEWGLPTAAGYHVSYGYFPPPSEERDTVLFVGVGAHVNKLRPYFTEVRPVAQMIPGPEARGRVGGDRPTTVWLLTGKHIPWTEIWPALRTV